MPARYSLHTQLHKQCTELYTAALLQGPESLHAGPAPPAANATLAPTHGAVRPNPPVTGQKQPLPCRAQLSSIASVHHHVLHRCTASSRRYRPVSRPRNLPDRPPPCGLAQPVLPAEARHTAVIQRALHPSQRATPRAVIACMLGGDTPTRHSVIWHARSKHRRRQHAAGNATPSTPPAQPPAPFPPLPIRVLQGRQLPVRRTRHATRYRPCGTDSMYRFAASTTCGTTGKRPQYGRVRASSWDHTCGMVSVQGLSCVVYGAANRVKRGEQ